MVEQYDTHAKAPGPWGLRANLSHFAYGLLLLLSTWAFSPLAWANWTALGGLKNGCNQGPSISDAIAMPNGDVYACGDAITMCTDQVIAGLAKFERQTDTWTAVPGVERMTPECRLALVGNRLVVASATGPVGVTNLRFAGVGNTNIAQLDLTTQVWSLIGAGINGPALALLAEGNDLFVAGELTVAGGAPAGRIARADLATGTWTSLATSAGSFIYTLERSGNYLYAGGLFDSIDGIPASKIARRNMTTGTWEPLGSGVNTANTNVQSIVSNNGELYIAGTFSAIGGINALRAAAVNEQSLSYRALDLPVTFSPSSLAKYQGKIYVSGGPGNSVFVRNADWDLVGSGGAFATNSARRRLATTTDGILIFGNMISMAGVRANGIAKFDPGLGTWSAMGNRPSLAVTQDESNDLDRVRVLLNTQHGLLAGGTFEEVGGTRSDGYARLSTNNWIDQSNNSIANRPTGVRALALLNADEVVVAAGWSPTPSSFNQYVARCQILSGICASLGGGVNGSVYTVYVDGSRVYLAGAFTQLRDTGQPSNGLAIFETATSTWVRFPTGVTNGSVYDIKKIGADLIMSGDFSSVEGVSAQSMVRYLPGSNQWQSLGATFVGGLRSVEGLALSNNGLYLTGSFTSINGIAMNGIAHWSATDSTWTALGSGLTGGVPYGIALKLVGENLYVGGQFTQAGGQLVNHIAAWDTRYRRWSPVSSAGGVGDPYFTPRVIAIEQLGNSLWISGDFRSTGGEISHNLAVLEPLQLFRTGFE